MKFQAHNIARDMIGLLPTLLCLFFLNCSLSPIRYHCAYDDYRPAIRRLLVLPPEISLFQDGPEGKSLWQDAGSREISQNTQLAVVQALSARAFSVRLADEVIVRLAAQSGLQTLYRNVNRSIQLHTYGPQIFPAKQNNFDYALGSVAELLDAADADALVLVMGRQTLSSQHPRTWLSVAVVEPNGDIVWYGLHGGKELVSLRTPEAALELVRQTLDRFLEARS